MPFRQSLTARTLAACFLVVPILGVTAGCGGAQTATAEGEQHPLVGKKAPELTVEPVTGEGPTTLGDAAGRVVVVDFWATYCAPCKKSFPKYQELSDQFGADLAIIAISLDDPEDITKEQIEEFATTAGVKFAVTWDKDRTAAPKYTPPKMPTSFIIDKEGVVRHMHAGYESGEEVKLAAEIEALLK